MSVMMPVNMAAHYHLAQLCASTAEPVAPFCRRNRSPPSVFMVLSARLVRSEGRGRQCLTEPQLANRRSLRSGVAEQLAIAGGRLSDGAGLARLPAIRPPLP